MVFMTDNEIATVAPSVFANEHDGNRSDRYVFVSSEKILGSMRDNGWDVTRVRQPRVRSASAQHCKHEMVFRSVNEDLSFEDPRLKVINHDNHHLDRAMVHPELKIFNSSDGTYRFQVEAGLFALICANGLTISLSNFGNFSHKHLDFNPEDAYNITKDFTSRVPDFMNSIGSFRDTDLDKEQKLNFATIGRNIRWGAQSDIAPQDLLEARRQEDSGSDLWTVFNVVQENLMRGGFSSGRRKARELTHIETTNKINKELWEAAESFAEYSLN